MTSNKQLTTAMVLAAILSGCGGGSGSEPAPPATTTKTFSVSMTAIDVDRSADQLALDVDGLPVQGATVRITE